MVAAKLAPQKDRQQPPRLKTSRNRSRDHPGSPAYHHSSFVNLTPAKIVRNARALIRGMQAVSLCSRSASTTRRSQARPTSVSSLSHNAPISPRIPHRLRTCNVLASSGRDASLLELACCDICPWDLTSFRLPTVKCRLLRKARTEN